MVAIVENVLGAFLIEMFMAVLLYGIGTAQAYVYWWNHREDTKLVRATVAAVWIVESVHTAFCLDLIYRYVILDFGEFANVGRIVWSAGATVMSAVVIAALVQGFFIRRIWILSKFSIVITGIPTALLFARIVFGFATSILTWKIETWAAFRVEKGPLVTFTCGLTLAAVVDLIIALSQTYFLWRSRTGYQGTDHLIRTLIAYVINTGALTTVVSTAILITFLVPALKNSLLFAGLVEIQSKLYANSFLATLNARRRMKSTSRGTKAYNSDTIELDMRRQTTGGATPSNIEIFKTTKVTGDCMDGMDDQSSSAERGIISLQLS